MQARYTPWWLPTALVVSLLVCVALFFALIAKAPEPVKAHVNTSEGVTSTQLVEWNLVTSWPKKFPGLGLGPENFAAMVKEMSGGRMLVHVHGANEIVPALGVFDAVSAGSVEMGHSAAYFWKGKLPAAPFFTTVPFGMTALEANAWLHYGGGLELWRELYEPYNIIPFAGGTTGVQMGGWYNKEINSIDDIRGLKKRIPGIGGEVFTRAGGEAVNIPGGELYTSLQSGVIDATEWVGPYNDLAFGFHQIAEYYYYPGWHEPGPILEFSVNKQAFEALPADLQKIVEVAARAVNQDMFDEYTQRSVPALDELLSKHQVEIRRYPDDVIETFRQTAMSLYQEYAQKDESFAKIHASYFGFLDGAAQYTRLSEEAYYGLRN